MALGKCAQNRGLPSKTIGLVQLRASQINGCSVCADMHLDIEGGRRNRRAAFHGPRGGMRPLTDAERAALALTEAVTRLSDRPDPVPDAIWEEAARHYDERAPRP